MLMEAKSKSTTMFLPVTYNFFIHADGIEIVPWKNVTPTVFFRAPIFEEEKKT